MNVQYDMYDNIFVCIIVRLGWRKKLRDDQIKMTLLARYELPPAVVVYRVIFPADRIAG